MTFNEQIDKIKTVFESCKTKEQLIIAYNWCNMFNSENNVRDYMGSTFLDPSYMEISGYIEDLYYKLTNKKDCHENN